MKYSDLVCDWLVELGYTKCFFVAGGNIMHLLESASHRFECIPFVHEVSAAIAAEFHNELCGQRDGRAFVLVTAGPGLTNCVTAIAGSFVESRELLVIGGQVKSSDLKRPGMRQMGIQEIDGISIVAPITKRFKRIEKVIDQEEFNSLVVSGRDFRKGPVFLEFCLDAQAELIDIPASRPRGLQDLEGRPLAENFSWDKTLEDLLKASRRPVILLGGEIERELSREFGELLNQLDIPIMTTWNAADRIAFTNENFFGRPNTWGMRFSNVIIQQADLLIALGTRLNIQQTGFNTDSFLPLGKIVHFFSDASEFSRPIKQRVASHAMEPSEYFSTVLKVCESGQTNYSEWLEYCKEIKKTLPLSEATNATHDGFWNPYDFYLELSEVLNDGDTLIPSSSGGAETVAMQAFMQREGVGIITNGSLASMGYGLAGAIGASLMRKGRVVLVEGDGGFAQNLQELGTVTAQNLNIAIFVFSNEGYASIRTTQRSYFGGHYVGCDSSTGLGLPDWSQLFPAFGIEASVLEPTVSLRELLSEQNDLPRAFIVPIHPEQSYFPKITSRVLTNGSMESNPLHMMTPPLDGATSDRVMKYLYL